MGFVDKGNQITAEKGHEMHLVYSFVKAGYVWEVEHGAQYPVWSNYIENLSEHEKEKITNKDNLNLEFLDFETEKTQIERGSSAYEGMENRLE